MNMVRLHNLLIKPKSIASFLASIKNKLLVDTLDEAKIMYDLARNVKTVIVSYDEFYREYLALRVKYSHLSEFQWAVEVFESYFVAFTDLTLFKCKNLLSGAVFAESYEIIAESIRLHFLIWNKFFYNTMKYTPSYKKKYFNPNMIFYKGNIFLERYNLVITWANKVLLSQILVFYKALKSTFLALAVSGLVFIILLNFSTTNLIRQLGVWLVVGLIFFWLISGFNFFLKRYRFGKFTAAIQRFWKRANSYFWLIEGFLFSLFFYYYLNSSQEPLYMYDESNLNQTHLFSLISAYVGYLLLVFLIFYSLYLILNLPNFNAKQQILHLTALTLGMIYIYLIESYQFYYILTSFIENFWIFDAQANSWTLEFEVPRLRTKHQYLLLALIAKYWHFLFIFLSWLFFTMKSFEQKRIYYPLFGVNIQNLVLLFGLNSLFYIQWLKWIMRRFYDVVYYWFFVDPNAWSVYLIFNSVYNFLFSVILNARFA